MSGGRRLTHEERVLWGKVVRSTRPLHGRTHPGEWVESKARPDPDVGVSPKAIRSSRVGPPPEPAFSASDAVPAVTPIERAVKRKIAKGQLALEASIDLHGLMQPEAHDLLLAFLMRAHARGLRHVLVITGKGSSRGSQGVLRRAVPEWLATPGFRPLVSGYETAGRSHGGEGALYIRLKRRRGDDT